MDYCYIYGLLHMLFFSTIFTCVSPYVFMYYFFIMGYRRALGILLLYCWLIVYFFIMGYERALGVLSYC